MLLINQQWLRGRLVERHCHKEVAGGRSCKECSVSACDNCDHYHEIPAAGWEYTPRLTDEQIKAKNWASL